MHYVSEIFLLIGLSLEFVGAFLLAIEAVGIGKMSTWRINYLQDTFRSLFRHWVRGPKINGKRLPAAGESIDRRAFVIGLITYSVFYIWINFRAIELGWWVGRNPWWITTLLIIFATYIWGSIFLVFLTLLFRYLIKFSVWAEKQKLRGSSATTGIIFLLIGFSLQMLGTALSLNE